MRRLAPLLALAALAACDRATEEKAPAPPPPAAAPVPGPFDGEFNALGTEPFWAVEVRAGGIKFSTPEGDQAFANPGPKVEAGKAVWPAEGLVLTLTAGTCSDGMSDRTYPYYAEVTVGIETMKGCAIRPGEIQPPA